MQVEKSNSFGSFVKLTLEDFKNDQKMSEAGIKWNPLLAMFLFSDASMTRNLEIIFRTNAKIKLLEEKKGIENARIEKLYTDQIEPELISRKIAFTNEEGKILMFAESVWNISAYESLMKDRGDAIGHNMRRQKFETFREINFGGAAVGDKEINKLLGSGEDENLLVRNYFMSNRGKRVCVIQEYFGKEVQNLVGL